MEEFYIRTWNVYNVHPIGHLINFLCPSYKKKRSFCYTNGWSVSNSCRLNFGKIENSSTSLLILQYFSNPMMPYYCSCVSPPEWMYVNTIQDCKGGPVTHFLILLTPVNEIHNKNQRLLTNCRKMEISVTDTYHLSTIAQRTSKLFSYSIISVTHNLTKSVVVKRKKDVRNNSKSNASCTGLSDEMNKEIHLWLFWNN